MTKDLEKKCSHHLKCIYCKKEFTPLDSAKHLTGQCSAQNVFIVNNITTVVIVEADKKPSFLHKLFHHFLKNF